MATMKKIVRDLAKTQPSTLLHTVWQNSHSAHPELAAALASDGISGIHSQSMMVVFYRSAELAYDVGREIGDAINRLKTSYLAQVRESDTTRFLQLPAMMLYTDDCCITGVIDEVTGVVVSITDTRL